MIMNIRQRLNKNYNELNGLYHDISMKLGLSDSESMVMYMLYDIQEPLTQSDIVKATGLSKQTLNSAIRKLEKENNVLKKENDIKQNTIINYANCINEYNNLSWIKKLSKIFKKDNIKLLN